MLPLFDYRISKGGAVVGLAALLAMAGAFFLATPVFWASTLGCIFLVAWLGAAALAWVAYVKTLRRHRRQRYAVAGAPWLPGAGREQRRKIPPRRRGLARE